MVYAENKKTPLPLKCYLYQMPILWTTVKFSYHNSFAYPLITRGYYHTFIFEQILLLEPVCLLRIVCPVANQRSFCAAVQHAALKIFFHRF